MKSVFPASLAILLMFGANLIAQDKATETAEASQDVPAVLNFTMKSIDGDDVEMKDFQGKVVVVVNVASKCGLTPQYEGLQALYKEHAEEGLVVLGFPCDQFRNQEFGSDAEIKTFCTEKYGVEFPMFSKVKVNGDDRCDLYKYLTELETKPAEKGDISWNFEKFLIGRDGKVVGRYSPRVKPGDDDFVEAIKAELEKKSSE